MFRCNIMTKILEEFLVASYTNFKLIQKNRRARIAKKILKTVSLKDDIGFWSRTGLLAEKPLAFKCSIYIGIGGKCQW